MAGTTYEAEGFMCPEEVEQGLGRSVAGHTVALIPPNQEDVSTLSEALVRNAESCASSQVAGQTWHYNMLPRRQA